MEGHECMDGGTWSDERPRGRRMDFSSLLHSLTRSFLIDICFNTHLPASPTQAPELRESAPVAFPTSGRKH